MRSKLETGPIVPPVPMKTGAFPKPRSIARAAAATAGCSRDVLRPRARRPRLRLDDDAAGRYAFEVRADRELYGPGSWPSTRRAESFALAQLGTIVLRPALGNRPKCRCTLASVAATSARAAGVRARRRQLGHAERCASAAASNGSPLARRARLRRLADAVVEAVDGDPPIRTSRNVASMRASASIGLTTRPPN
jgi:hypothetical protein